MGCVKKIIIGNWKLNPRTKTQAITLIKDILCLKKDTDMDICIIPPEIFVPDVASTLEFTDISIGAQNCHYENDGAYTGETSAESLKDYGVKYILCGHSERRALFGETDNTINKKVRKVVETGLTAVLCVGESLEQKELGLVNEICNSQIKIGLNGVQNQYVDKIIIAYEPVWAIGTGKVCDADDAEKVIKQLRILVSSIYENGRAIRIVYGGSVNGNNINNLLKKDIDGFLVGGASINAENFVKIINPTL